MTPCKEWAGYRDKDGYGTVSYKGKMWRAHRLAYAQSAGMEEIPGNKVVRHKCDNPGCVNPDHLELGTQAQNLADMVARGRSTAKLSLAECGQIRSLYVKGSREFGSKSLGRRFNVSHRQILNIIHGISRT